MNKKITITLVYIGDSDEHVEGLAYDIGRALKACGLPPDLIASNVAIMTTADVANWFIQHGTEAA